MQMRSVMRQGIGRAMMTAVETMARAHQAVRLEAHVAPDAVGFYRKIGWELVDAHRPILSWRSY
jgi:GNAT superfamily N-acetyltransferase